MAPRQRLLAPTVLAVLLTACGGVADDAADPTSASSEPTMNESSTPDVEPGLQGFVDQATGDLADRLDVEPASITVVSAEAVSWGDTSLGCPQPGMRYAQVVTDGTKIVLEHDGTEYAYHSGGDRSPFLCEEPQQPVKDSKSPAPTIDRTAEDG